MELLPSLILTKQTVYPVIIHKRFTYPLIKIKDWSVLQYEHRDP